MMPEKTSPLWPPDGTVHLCATLTDVYDICDADPSVEIVVTASEPTNGPGKGSAEPDWEVVENGDTREVWLRAERLGSYTDRVYTVTATVTDDSGNAATDQATVTVPHDQGIGVGRK